MLNSVANVDKGLGCIFLYEPDLSEVAKTEPNMKFKFMVGLDAVEFFFIGRPMYEEHMTHEDPVVYLFIWFSHILKSNYAYLA